MELSRASLLLPLFPIALLEIGDVKEEDDDLSDVLRSISKGGGGGE